MNEYQRVVCFAMSPTSIDVAGFALMVCKLQSRFTNTPRVRIRCVKIRIRHPHMKRWIDVKWCVINLCFGWDRLQDKVKQLILPIAVFCILLAYILRLSNHVFGCSDPGYYFRFVGLLVQYIIIILYLFHNSIRTCFIQSKNQQGATFKNNTHWCKNNKFNKFHKLHVGV